MLESKAKKQIIEKFKIHPTDTGSSDVQIALLTERIKTLSGHFKGHPKDFSSRHGFLKLIGQRRRLLNYLKRDKDQNYGSVIKKLELDK
ncbi:MAG: 30S ribosomal protein S15 [Elusimicrobia bacterium CG1_02_37_114]|nr:MAG: 30S ribosomal protein S15 [Elusimicrobia bacterium CG1_02_37_114]PIV52394.1 MAG: 30S ribosomal protein S15 [Elusimicrobia bacterium CG02_land_8_20_14_3_00_37_13]PIZ14105.1 MAG: 30S ribosomal protein S15 [Elusimicrobia bacterium CG_4_10_14_0_8_um_filter_37_32]